MTERRRSTLTREGWYYLLVVSIIVVGAVWRQVNLMIILAGLMVGPLLLSWRISGATLRRLRPRRHMPQWVHAGDTFGVEISVRNLRTRLSSWFVGVMDRISFVGGAPQTHSTTVDVLLPQIPAGELSKTVYRCSLPQRGSYEFGPMSVYTRFPLGLLKCSRRVERNQTLVALPRLGRLTKRWDDLVQSRQPGLRRSLGRRALTDGIDLYGVRDWQPGDSRRSIHWRVTAKLGQLAVRQFEQLDRFDLTLILDLWQPEEATEAHAELVETAVSFAATAVHEACRQTGPRLRVIVLGHEPWQRQGSASPRLRLDVLHELAFRNASCDYDAGEQLQSLAAAASGAQPLAVISTRSAEQAGVALAGNELSGRLARRLNWLCVADSTLDRYFQLASPDGGPHEPNSTLESQKNGKRTGRPNSAIVRRAGERRLQP